MELLGLDYDADRGAAIWDIVPGTFVHYFPLGYQEELLPFCMTRDGRE